MESMQIAREEERGGGEERENDGQHARESSYSVGAGNGRTFCQRQKEVEMSSRSDMRVLEEVKKNKSTEKDEST